MHVTMNIPICTSQMKVENKLARTSLITKDKTINEQLRRGKKKKGKKKKKETMICFQAPTANHILLAGTWSRISTLQVVVK